jgi:DNA-binding transcriptional MerR regulator
LRLLENNTPYGAMKEEKNMPKAQRFSLEQIHAVLKKLRSLPPKKVGKTRAEAVECLAGDIRKAVEKGHSLKEIRDILAGEGIQVSLTRMAVLMKTGEEADQKKEDASAPGQAEAVDCGLLTIPWKKKEE